MRFKSFIINLIKKCFISKNGSLRTEYGKFSVYLTPDYWKVSAETD